MDAATRIGFWKFFRILPRIWCDICGVLVLILLISYGILLIVTPERYTPVWSVKEFTLETPSVKARQELVYTMSIDANDSCPGQVIHTFLNVKTNVLVVMRRPVVQPGTNIEDRKFSTQLPSSVHPGRWKVVGTIDSMCPTRRVTDRFAEFEIDVVDGEEPKG